LEKPHGRVVWRSFVVEFFGEVIQGITAVFHPAEFFWGRWENVGNSLPLTSWVPAHKALHYLIPR
jgi:hypothetical protein